MSFKVLNLVILKYIYAKSSKTFSQPCKTGTAKHAKSLRCAENAEIIKACPPLVTVYKINLIHVPVIEESLTKV